MSKPSQSKVLWQVLLWLLLCAALVFAGVVIRKQAREEVEAQPPHILPLDYDLAHADRGAVRGDRSEVRLSESI
jgi:hypothetical protein